MSRTGGPFPHHYVKLAAITGASIQCAHRVFPLAKKFELVNKELLKEMRRQPPSNGRAEWRGGDTLLALEGLMLDPPSAGRIEWTPLSFHGLSSLPGPVVEAIFPATFRALEGTLVFLVGGNADLPAAIIAPSGHQEALPSFLRGFHGITSRACCEDGQSIHGMRSWFDNITL